MTLLMGLNDTYAQIRGQLLLMDPLPPFNKAFSLATQEEHQWKAGVQMITDNTSSMAF